MASKQIFSAYVVNSSSCSPHHILGCDGACVVCRDLIQPGPSELAEGAQLGLELQTQEQRQRYELAENRQKLFSMCRNGDLEGLSAALSGTRVADVVDVDRMSLLHWTSLRGFPAVARLLICRVASDTRVAYIDSQDSGGCTALHYASQEGNLAAAVTLLFHGASPELKDIQG